MSMTRAAETSIQAVSPELIMNKSSWNVECPDSATTVPGRETGLYLYEFINYNYQYDESEEAIIVYCSLL
jgi:hypothetical protein